MIWDFVHQFPLLQPHISFSDRFIDPVHDGVDIVVRIGGNDAWSAALGHRYFGAQRLIFCASPAYIEAHGAPLSEQDLDNHHCIGYLEEDGLVSPWFFRGHQPGEMERRIMHSRIAVGDGQGEVSAILAGHGIGQLPTWGVQPHLESGDIVEVLSDLSTDGLPMNLVWLKSREGLPKVKGLLDYLAERLGPHGAKRSV